MKFFPPLPHRFQCPAYLEFVGSLGCVCKNEECVGAVQAHHFIYQSEGKKSSDLDTIGLCAFHHRKAHDLGRERFLFQFEFNFEALRKGYVERFLIQAGVGTGKIVTTNRKPKTSTRKNRKPFTKKFVPLKER